MKNPIVTIEMENGDIMKAELYPEIAPNTVKNFIDLINNMDISKYDITVMSIWDYGVRKKDLRKDVKYKSIFPNIKGISKIFHNL